MPNYVKFRVGTIATVDDLPARVNGDVGQILFAIDANNYGYLYYNKDASTRVLMGTSFRVAEAAIADKAISDNRSQQIDSTYIKGLSVSGTTITYTKGDGTTGTITTQDNNTQNTAGSTNTTDKIFIIGAKSQAANPQTYSNSKVYITNGVVTADEFVGKLTGNADSATLALKDNRSQQIDTTYIKGLSVSGTTITITKGDGTTSTITTQDTNTKNTAGSTNTTDKIFLIGAKSQDANPQTYSNSAIYATNGVLTATKFVGALEGNADTATAATYDNHSYNIDSYIRSLSISGKTITYTKGDGTSGTLTTQDNDTKNTAGSTNDAATLYIIGAKSQAANPQTYSHSGATMTAGVITAAGFVGDLTGNADTATAATYDNHNYNIDSYIRNLSISGKTITITKGDGTTSTITTQDTNTDTKVTNTLATTTKFYITGTSSATTNTGTQYFDTGVYVSTTAGELVANSFKGDLDGNAATATKATQDSRGQQIDTTYIKGLSASSTTLTYTLGSGTTGTVDIAALPLAGGTMTGAIKRYYNATSTDPMLSVTSSDKDVLLWQIGHGTNDTISTSNYYKLQYKGTGSSPNNLLQLIAARSTSTEVIAAKVDENGNVTFTNTVTANISGSANSATYDNHSYNIDSYVRSVSLSGTTITVTKGDGTSSTLTTQDNDTKNTAGSTNDTATLYIIGAKSQAANPQTYSNSNVTMTAGVITASGFVGDLTGNADTATSATYDNHSYNIDSYIRSLSISGKTITYTKGDGTSGTLTTQDTNTDTKVTNTLGTTTKFYITGTTSATTNTGTQYFDTGVYVSATAGELVANSFKGDLDGNAASATKALQDNGGRQIDTTYIKSLSVSSNASKYTITPVLGSGSNGTAIDITGATDALAGLMTTDTQTFAGAKTFSTSISTPQLTVTGTGKFNYSGIESGTTNADRVVWFADSASNGKPVYNTNFKYNPSTNKLTVGNIDLSGNISMGSGADSTHSTSSAALKVTGGASISMNLSAKSVRVDNGSTTKGVKLQFNETDEYLSYVFA